MQNTLPSRGAVFVLLALLMPACIRVDPAQDYARAGKLVADRTGATESYDPSADLMIDQKVAMLLAEGLTIDEAARVALLRNRGFQSMFAELGVSRAAVVQSGLLTNPTFGFMARFPEGGGRSSLTFDFAQDVVDFWQIPVRKAAAKAQLEQTLMSLAQRAVDLTADTRAACYRYLALVRAEQITRENLELVETSLKLARNRFGAGEAGQLDVNLARAAQIEVQLNLITVRRDLSVAKVDLARVLGLARWEGSWELRDNLEVPARPIGDDASLTLQAMRQRLDAKAAEYAVRAAEAELRKQELSVFSEVSVGTELERSERRALPGRNILADTARASARAGAPKAPDIQTRGERNLERRQIIDAKLGPSLMVRVPLWDQNQAQIARASYQLEQKKKEYEDLLDNVARQVQSAAATARTGAELVGFYATETLPTARENVDVAQQAYQAGEQGIVALIDAQRFQVSQRLAALNVSRDYSVSLAELERVMGGPLSPTATTQPSGDGKAD